VADAVAARWDYLLVDEFQDLNPAQYDILKRLARPHGNFFAVGDDEQSIFSWAGADPRLLARFREDFAIEKPVVLDRNCRCSHQIFETARRLLSENPQLFDKQLTAERESEYDVRAYAFADEAAEAEWLLEDLVSDRAASRRNGGDFFSSVRDLARTRPANAPDTKKLWRFVYQVENLAALYRSHHSLPALVDELLSQSVGPYRNVLEERHDELSDPAGLPEAIRLAERLEQAIAEERDVFIEPQGGVEIALRGLLAGTGVRHVPSPAPGRVAAQHDVVLRAADGGDVGLA